MQTDVIVKTHELALKGRNRPWFMRHLVDNLRQATRGTGVTKVWQGQLLVGLTLKVTQKPPHLWWFLCVEPLFSPSYLD